MFNFFNTFGSVPLRPWCVFEGLQSVGKLVMVHHMITDALVCSIVYRLRCFLNRPFASLENPASTTRCLL